MPGEFRPPGRQNKNDISSAGRQRRATDRDLTQRQLIFLDGLIAARLRRYRQLLTPALRLPGKIVDQVDVVDLFLVNT